MTAMRNFPLSRCLKGPRFREHTTDTRYAIRWPSLLRLDIRYLMLIALITLSLWGDNDLVFQKTQLEILTRARPGSNLAAGTVCCTGKTQCGVSLCAVYLAVSAAARLEACKRCKAWLVKLHWSFTCEWEWNQRLHDTSQYWTQADLTSLGPNTNLYFTI